MQADKLFGRAKAILLTPRAEWPIIAAEPDTIRGIYTGYILILAAFPALKNLLSLHIIGWSFPLARLAGAITVYVGSLLGTFLVALIVDALAPNFGGQKDRVQALKVAAYANTAVWVAAIIGIVPGLGLLSGLAGIIYGLYLFNLGLPFTMKCPAEKSLGYTVVTVLVAFAAAIVLSLIMRAVGGLGALGGMWGSHASDSSMFSDHSAAGNSLVRSFGKVESLAPDQIKTFLPEELDGLKRTQQAVERNGAMGMQISKAAATYSDGANRSLNLEIVDTGSLKGMIGFASGWAGIEQEKQTDSGYEKTYKSDGQLIHELWNKNTGSGEYTTFVADRFAVKVTGAASDIGDLKRAAAGIDTAGLAALKNSGVAAN